MGRDRGGDDNAWATTGIWEGSTEQARLTRAVLADREPCDNCGARPGTPEYEDWHDSQNCWAGYTPPAKEKEAKDD